MLAMNSIIDQTTISPTISPSNQQQKWVKPIVRSMMLASIITSIMATSSLAMAITDESQFQHLPNTMMSLQNEAQNDEILIINHDNINDDIVNDGIDIIDDGIETNTSLAKQLADDNDIDAGEAIVNDDSLGNIDTQSIDSITQSTQPATPYNQNITLSQYAKEVNRIHWYEGMKQNNAMTAKLQALLDWNHASPGPIDGGWGMNSIKALKNFQAMKGLKQTGKMDTATWQALNKNISASEPVLKAYTITKEDVKTNFATTPSGSQAKSKMKGLYYQDIYEMLAERFHMDVRYLKKLNTNKKFVEGDIITVYNPGKTLNLICLSWRHLSRHLPNHRWQYCHTITTWHI